MRRNRRVKIVATLGPASSEPEMLERLFEAGVDVFRINMSHASHDVGAQAARHRAHRPKSSSSGRSASCATCRDRSSASARSRGGTRVRRRGRASSTSTATRAPGGAERIFLPHPQIFAGDRARAHPAARRRQAAHARGREVGIDHHRRGDGRRRAGEPQGHQPCPTRCCRSRRSPRRIAPTSTMPCDSASTGSRCRSCSGARTSIDAAS